MIYVGHLLDWMIELRAAVGDRVDIVVSYEVVARTMRL